jgi:hypothetical protein
MGGGGGLVAPTPPIHLGALNTPPPPKQPARGAAPTLAFARSCISDAFIKLRDRDFAGFAAHASANKSDFRDVGPVLASLLPSHFKFEISGLRLVDYADVLGSPDPTWVAAALVELTA